MKLLANLECLTPPLTGIGHYTGQLAARLAHHPRIDVFKGLYRNRWLDGAQLQGWPPTASLQRGNDKAAWLRAQLREVPGSYMLRHRLRRLRFARLSHQCEKDAYVYWEPGLELMPFAGRRVATLYDLSHLAIPASHPAYRVDHLARQTDYMLRHADNIVTISYTMRREIAVYAGLEETDIAVVSPAAAPEFRPILDKGLARRQLGLPERYILSIGTLEPRKNLERLIHAYATLPKRLRQTWPLVCIGAKGWQDTTLDNMLNWLERQGDLIRLGYVSQQAIPVITGCADLLTYPSLYEGFGMPVIEAMACGVPVLTSRNTSMHEITQEHAFLVEPTSIDSIASSLLSALEDPERRNRLGAQGIRRAATYDWEKSTDELVSILDE